MKRFKVSAYPLNSGVETKHLKMKQNTGLEAHICSLHKMWEHSQVTSCEVVVVLAGLKFSSDSWISSDCVI